MLIYNKAFIGGIYFFERYFRATFKGLERFRFFSFIILSAKHILENAIKAEDLNSFGMRKDLAELGG